MGYIFKCGFLTGDTMKENELTLSPHLPKWNDIQGICVEKKVNLRRTIFYVLATSEFTFLHLTFEIKAHRIINSVLEAVKISGKSSICKGRCKIHLSEHAECISGKPFLTVENTVVFVLIYFALHPFLKFEVFPWACITSKTKSNLFQVPKQNDLGNLLIGRKGFYSHKKLVHWRWTLDVKGRVLSLTHTWDSRDFGAIFSLAL